MNNLYTLVNRSHILTKMIIGVVRGRVILIEDKDTKCSTFIGSKIKPERVNLLIFNVLKANPST